MAKKPVILNTASESYTTSRLLGQGGAGRVFAAADSSGRQFAVKLVENANSSSEHSRRFKNELMFSLRNQHENIVTISDFGTYERDGATFPFYVMPLYSGTLRSLLSTGISEDRVVPSLLQMLNGVEAAHLRGVIHRDLKPENILHDEQGRLVIADFGIARFSEEELATAVRTRDGTRLANFQYAAPEQRAKGAAVDHRADIFALGLMLYEMATGRVPQGTGFKSIASGAQSLSYLDDIAATMIRQDPNERFGSIAEIKNEITARGNVYAQQQKIDQVRKMVVPVSEITDDTVMDPPRLVSVDVQENRLVFVLSKSPPSAWVDAFHGLYGVHFYPNQGPRNFYFNRNTASIQLLHDGQGQALADCFKEYLAKTITNYETLLRENQRQKEHDARTQLRKAAEIEERRLAMIKQIKI